MILQQLLIAQWHFCCGCALDQLHFSLERGVGGMFIYLRVGKCSRQHILFQASCTVHLQIPGSPIKTYPLPQGTAWQALLTWQHWQLFGSFWSGSNLVWVCYTFILSTSSKQITESRIPSCVLQWKCFNVWELLLLQGRYRALLTVSRVSEEGKAVPHLWAKHLLSGLPNECHVVREPGETKGAWRCLSLWVSALKILGPAFFY